MNSITLRGVLKDIQHSHNIGDVDFSKAQIVVTRPDGKEDILSLRFKSLSTAHQDGDMVSIVGNLRSYSQKLEDKNKVTIYVFTYFDEPEDADECNNKVSIDGRICKMNPLRPHSNHKHSVHFILANNLQSRDGQKRLNSYIPCIAWGKIAKELSELPVSTKLNIKGELHSRVHKKKHPDGSVEERMAHELYITEYEVVE